MENNVYILEKARKRNPTNHAHPQQSWEQKVTHMIDGHGQNPDPFDHIEFFVECSGHSAHTLLISFIHYTLSQ